MNFICPNCNKNFQIDGKGNEAFNCQDCGCRITTINGWMSSWKADEDIIIDFKIKQIKKKRKLRLFYIVLGVIIFIFVLWKLFISEYIDYRSALNSNNIDEYKYFLDDYPGSRYYPEIFQLYDDMSFQNAIESSSDTGNTSCNCDKLKEYLLNFRKNGKHIEETKLLVEECTFNIIKREMRFNDIVKFYKDYPESKYLSKVDSIYGRLYETLIKKYDSVAYENKLNSKSYSLFRSILKHIFDKKSGVIYIYFDKKLELKDWVEFSTEIKQHCDDMYNIDILSKEYLGIVKPVKSPPPSLKSNFNDENISSLEQIVINELDSTLLYIFNDSCCEIVRMPYDTSFSDNIMIKINYKIKNSDLNEEVRRKYPSEYFPVVPCLWISSESQGIGRGTFKGYVLGIGIEWNCEFKIPNNQRDFNFKDYSEPIEEIQTDMPSEVYIRMTEQAFLKFTEKITNNLEIHRDSIRQE